MSTSPVSPTGTSFTGISQFAGDLQQALLRAISFASLPLQQLQTDQSTINSQISAAQSLQTQVTGLSTALQTLAAELGNTLSASVSDTSVLLATATASALPGSYTVKVNNIGSYSTATSANGLPAVTDPTTQSISTSSSFSLTVGTTTYNIQPASNNLNALATAINASGAGVQATIVNIGGPTTPDYRLALQATSLGGVSLQLSAGTTQLLSSPTLGTDATYTVNGQPSTGPGISTNSRTVTIAPGLTVTLQTAGTATVLVANNTTNLSSALSGFVAAYNSALAELGKSIGQNPGPLAGDSVVSSVSQSLQQIMQYSIGSGTVRSLSDLGIKFTQQGTLTFDPTALGNMSTTQVNDALNFLGTPTSGGFLESATNTMNGLLDPSSGIITTDISAMNQQSTADAQNIQAEQNRLNVLQSNLAQQMAAQDALIASLEQQQSYLSQLFTTTNANNFGQLNG